ncbi:soluble secreted antigen MPT53 [Acidimicrobiaceae bacterium]|nr:soluble secreted antigen MPT53 [Acidimicrobiaceae bacterium]
MQSFIADTGITFANINDGDGEVFARFEVPYQPGWAFVARDGTVTTKIGVLTEAELDQELNRLATN